MTDERRQDVLIGALVLSLIAHIALMLLIKPQIMTHVTSSAAMRTRAREKMVVKDAPKEIEPLKMTTVPDVEAFRESPEAAEDLIPLAKEFNAADEVAKSEAPVASPPKLDETLKPALEVAPYLSEKIHVEAGLSSVTTPIAAESVRAHAPRQLATAPVVADGQTGADVPLFTAPTIVSQMPQQAVAEMPVSLPDDASANGKDAKTFIPKDEVLATVDEKVVHEEKEAVRELLNVKDAQELAKFVNLATTSATAGEWTYLRVQIHPRNSLMVVPKDVVVLLDASGSIGNDRLKSCRAAARKLLRSCTNTGDRFNLVAFRDKFSYAFRSWQSCDQASFDQAEKWLDGLGAHGRTDVFAVIRSVLTLPRNPTRPLIALVVTDGEANAGVHETAQILSQFTKLNDGLISVYMYGVKGTANRELIDVLTRGNRGESYIYDGFRWGAGSYIEDLCEHFREPVLSDLRVLFATGTAIEAYPQRLRNLYRNGLVDFVARVPRGTKEVGFSLKGLNGATSYESFFKVDLASAAFDEQLPARWKSEQAIDLKLR